MTRNPRPEHARANRANQLNPKHPAYFQSRGATAEQVAARAPHAESALDNHANQVNPNNDAYCKSRRVSGLPGSSSNASTASPSDLAMTLDAPAPRGVGAEASRWRIGMGHRFLIIESEGQVFERKGAVL